MSSRFLLEAGRTPLCPSTAVKGRSTCQSGIQLQRGTFNLVFSQLIAIGSKETFMFLYLSLSMKESFFLAFMSTRRVWELEALMAEPPYMAIHRVKVSIRLHPSFFPKVVS